MQNIIKMQSDFTFGNSQIVYKSLAIHILREEETAQFLLHVCLSKRRMIFTYNLLWNDDSRG